MYLELVGFLLRSCKKARGDDNKVCKGDFGGWESWEGERIVYCRTKWSDSSTSVGRL